MPRIDVKNKVACNTYALIGIWRLWRYVSRVRDHWLSEMKIEI